MKSFYKKTIPVKVILVGILMFDLTLVTLADNEKTPGPLSSLIEEKK